jgi:hypothetical protein
VIAEIDRRRQARAPKEIDQSILCALFESESVQEEIDKRIVEEIYYFIPKMEEKHRKLVKEKEEYAAKLTISPEPCFFLMYFKLNSYRGRTLRYMKENVALCELTLIELREFSLVVAKLREAVLDRLYQTAFNQIKASEDTEQEINKLRKRLSFSYPLKKFVLLATSFRQNYWIHENKPVPKNQRKYSKR